MSNFSVPHANSFPPPGVFKPHIEINRLEPTLKREVWSHLQRAHPDIAESLTLLKEDEIFQQLLSNFNASVIVAEDLLRPILPKKIE